jgi:hypothetical protein
MLLEDAYSLASRVKVRLADGQLGRMVVFRLTTESVDVELPGGRLRNVPSTRLNLENGLVVEQPA